MFACIICDGQFTCRADILGHTLEHDHTILKAFGMHPTTIELNFDKCWNTAAKRREISNASRDRKRAAERAKVEISLAMAPKTKLGLSAEEAGATDKLIQTTKES